MACDLGPLDQPRNRYLYANVVGGIGGYGNCLGIPTVGGDLAFDATFSGNPLVNAMCVGVAPRDALMRATASGPGNLIVLIGAETGRDGLHGATFASVNDPEASHRGVVQVGNPFLEKLLLEACLELLGNNAVVAMQDLGAAGLTSSVVECASRGDVGAEIDVASVPRRETGMTAYEVMLSESQERMLLVVQPDHFGEVRDVVERWSLKAAVIGRVTDDGLVRVLDSGELVAEIPAKLLTDECPTYVPEAAEPPTWAERRQLDLAEITDLTGGDGPGTVGGALMRLLQSPNIGSRRAVYEQYDYTILTNTVVPPGAGDAAVLRLKGTGRGIAASLDGNSRYCALRPERGARHAVAEATRNVSCVGGRPLAITNCLNFGNPEKPDGYEQLRQAVAGMAEACRALEVPVVSGNVSLYNETADSPIQPTPMIGAIGILDDIRRHATMRWRADETILLIGNERPELGGSEYLAYVHELTRGEPPAIDLGREAAVQAVVRMAIADDLIATAHDCGVGGLAVALTEMAVASDVGAHVIDEMPEGEHGRLDEAWFGEAPSRIIVSCADSKVAEMETLGANHGVPVRILGRTGGARLRLGRLVEQAVDELRRAYESALSVEAD